MVDVIWKRNVIADAGRGNECGGEDESNGKANGKSQFLMVNGARLQIRTAIDLHLLCAEPRLHVHRAEARYKQNVALALNEDIGPFEVKLNRAGSRIDFDVLRLQRRFALGEQTRVIHEPFEHLFGCLGRRARRLRIIGARFRL